MIQLSLRRHDPTSRRERLENLLALLTLVALGIVWPGADAATPVERHAGTLLLQAGPDAPARRGTCRLPAGRARRAVALGDDCGRRQPTARWCAPLRAIAARRSRCGMRPLQGALR